MFVGTVSLRVVSTICVYGLYMPVVIYCYVRSLAYPGSLGLFLSLSLSLYLCFLAFMEFSRLGFWWVVGLLPTWVYFLQYQVMNGYGKVLHMGNLKLNSPVDTPTMPVK